MSKLKGLLLTEGLHGMISQVEGLAKALNLEYFHEKIELNNFWKLIPPSLTPVKKYVFKNNIEKEFDIIISCLLYTSPSPRDRQKSRMPSSA